jgi:hypothetical protein
MSKASRNHKLKAEKKDRNHVVVSKETNPRMMANQANAAKARRLNRDRASNPVNKAFSFR